MLFVIDRRPYQAELERAQAQLEQAQAQQKQAQGEFERIAPLKGTGAASEIDIFNARQRVEAAKQVEAICGPQG
jgi:membrane fusion protein (multidrug efflux system)